jgi:hypothetical protein
MNGIDLKNRLAKAQSENDYLISELGHVDGLLREVGFEAGLETLKAAAEEVIYGVGTSDA